MRLNLHGIDHLVTQTDGKGESQVHGASARSLKMHAAVVILNDALREALDRLDD